MLSLVTTSCVKIGHLANTSVKNQRSSDLIFAESKCADTGTNNDSGILQRSQRSVEPMCFRASHRALLPHETAWVSCLRAAPTFKFNIRRISGSFSENNYRSAQYYPRCSCGSTAYCKVRICCDSVSWCGDRPKETAESHFHVTWISQQGCPMS